MLQITLKPEEIRLADAIAAQRTKQNRAANRSAAIQGAGSNEHYDRIGMRGELAFCKLFNVYPDLSWADFDPTTDKGDCYVSHWGYVDVKTTERADGNLVITANKKPKPGAYFSLMLALPDNRFECYGLIKQEDALSPANLKQLRPENRPAYFIARNTLSFYSLSVTNKHI